MKRFIVGSTYFFKKIKDFKPKDIDYAVIVDNPVGFTHTRQTMYGSYDIFEYARKNPVDILEYIVKAGLPMRINVVLVPEFNKEMGIKIEHLSIVKPLIDKLDDKHKYLKVIYDSYIENGDFTLTEEQLNKAYESYTAARKDKEKEESSK